HITSSTGSLIIPLSADFTQADVQDNQRYPAITSSLPNKVRYIAADFGYDDHKLYKLSTDKGFENILSDTSVVCHRILLRMWEYHATYEGLKRS
ncbi:MAG: transposase, partial [Candidatus Nitrosopolaris sp.]